MAALDHAERRGAGIEAEARELRLHVINCGELLDKIGARSQVNG